MASTPVRHASAADEATVYNIITLAFATDPPCRWVYPDPHQFIVHFPDFVRGFGGRAFLHDSAYIVEGNLGAALWLPPEVHPDDAALDSLLAKTLSGERQKDTAAVLGQMASYHPVDPHWHLTMIGVDPTRLHQGLGSALLQAGLDECDRAGQIAYLESTNLRNLPLYERHGFEVVGRIDAAGCPPIFPMVRKARPASRTWSSDGASV